MNAVPSARRLVYPPKRSPPVRSRSTRASTRRSLRLQPRAGLRELGRDRPPRSARSDAAPSARPVPLDPGVDQEVVAAAAQCRLEEARPETPAEIGALEVVDALD